MNTIDPTATGEQATDRPQWPELDTPCLRIDLDKLERNLQEMASAAASYGVKLRPHIKTHKMTEIARRQLELGAIGLTTAKLSEAEVFASKGFKELFVCYPLVGEIKLRRLRELSRSAHVMTLVESERGARDLAAAMSGEEKPLDVLIKVDVGMHRVGVPHERALELATLVAGLPSLNLKGICIHEGTVYGEPDPHRRAEVGQEQARQLVQVAEQLRGSGFGIEIVSCGSTPGAAAVMQVGEVTEIRPGNYVFYDVTQASMAVTDLDHCALSVVVTVVSHSAPDRAVVDAGSKALTVDRGAHGTSALPGYGLVRGRPGITVEKLSEEHGWLKLDEGEQVEIGERLDIIPNHACPVANNFYWAAVTRGDQVVDRWTVDARGCMT